MPRVELRILIVAFWLIMTGGLVQRDLLPLFGIGELTYQRVLADRAVEEPVHWVLRLGEKKIGRVTTNVRPEENGSFVLLTRARLRGNLFQADADGAKTLIEVKSEFFVSGLGRLQRFALSAGFEGTTLRARVEGQVSGNELVIRSLNVPLLAGETRVAFDPESLLLDTLGPLDRLPDLRLNQTWITRTVNPVAVVLPTGPLFGQGPPFQVVRHRVVNTATVDWNEQSWRCYVVEHAYDNLTAHSWVRRSDGKVLRQEVPVGGLKLVIELDPGGKILEEF